MKKLICETCGSNEIIKKDGKLQCKYCGTKYNDNSINIDVDKLSENGLKVAKGVGVGYLVFIGIIVVIAIVIFAVAFTFIFNTQKKVNDVNDEIFDDVNDMIDSSYDEFDVKSFNGNLEMYSGTKYGSQVSSLLDNVVTKIKKNSDHSISVVYGDKTTSSPDEIVSLKSNFEQWTEYEVSLDYDTNGFVNKVTISNK